MSLEEIIDQAKALSTDEQLQLVRAVEKDYYTRLERQYAESLPPNSVASFWHFDTTREAMELMQRELEDYRTRTQ
jgi:hypothetical protein